MVSQSSNTLAEFFIQQGLTPTYWVAFSGGMDSHVLLDLCIKARAHLPLKLCVVHIHHGLSPFADAWVTHCVDICRQYQVHLVQKTIDVTAVFGASPENAARQGRYAVFAELLSDNDILLTAHHQDDQAETVLLQLFRGAGPKGLAAMPFIKPFAKGQHARPLLTYTRGDLKHYATQAELKWIEDESNLDDRYTRNFLRNTILPQLKNRWPSITATLARVASHCASEQTLLESMADADLTSVSGSIPDTLSISRLRDLDLARQTQVVRFWFSKNNLPLPSTAKIQQIHDYFLTAAADKCPHLTWRGVELRRFRDHLYVLPTLSAHDNAGVWEWDLTTPLMIRGIGQLTEYHDVTQLGLRRDVTKVIVRFRQGGETCYSRKRGSHHALKKLFQQWDVPSWQRDRVPLIFVGEQLVCVVGYFLAEEFAELGGYRFVVKSKVD